MYIEAGVYFRFQPFCKRCTLKQQWISEANPFTHDRMNHLVFWIQINNLFKKKSDSKQLFSSESLLKFDLLLTQCIVWTTSIMLLCCLCILFEAWKPSCAVTCILFNQLDGAQLWMEPWILRHVFWKYFFFFFLNLSCYVEISTKRKAIAKYLFFLAL